MTTALEDLKPDAQIRGLIGRDVESLRFGNKECQG
jgi:hypothetical protein